MKYIITESQLKKIIDSELDERSRSLANTRKKRIFPKSAIMSNPDRFKEYDKEVKGLNEEEETDIKWDIKAVECGENKTSGMVDVKTEGDNIIAKIRYCKGDDEDKEYLKKKAHKLIEKKYKL